MFNIILMHLFCSTCMLFLLVSAIIIHTGQAYVKMGRSRALYNVSEFSMFRRLLPHSNGCSTLFVARACNVILWYLNGSFLFRIPPRYFTLFFHSSACLSNTTLCSIFGLRLVKRMTSVFVQPTFSFQFVV